ncbi:hypothetical protein [Afifella sp. YEN Y35]
MRGFLPVRTGLDPNHPVGEAGGVSTKSPPFLDRVSKGACQ